MSIAHVVYVPTVFLVGLIVGWIAGSRAARSELAKQGARLKR